MNGVQYSPWTAPITIIFFDGDQHAAVPVTRLHCRSSRSTRVPRMPGTPRARHGRSTVSAVMKSGTNSFHGDVFQISPAIPILTLARLLREHAGRPDSVTSSAVFSAALSRRTSCFSSWAIRGLSCVKNPVQAPTFVPTPAMLQGNFTTIASPACQVSDRSPWDRCSALSGGSAPNTINPGLFDPAAVKIAALLPQPTNPNGCGQFTYSHPAQRERSRSHDEVALRGLSVQRQAKPICVRNMLVKQIIAVP